MTSRAPALTWFGLPLNGAALSHVIGAMLGRAIAGVVGPYLAAHPWATTRDVLARVFGEEAAR